MQLVCPACHTPLPATPPGQAHVACTGCSADIDLSRLGTVAGRPRFVPERDRTGAVVGRWTIEARIGAGGMGQVYRARDGQCRAALKFLAAGLAGDPALVARFHREVQVLAALDHEAIVRIVESGEDEGVPWFAMTLVEGESLRTRLARGPLDPQDARQVFARVLAALAHAHDRGVVHRDLKPANVLLSPQGTVVADFGIARPEEAFVSGMTRLTETAAVLGTVPYMSPEQRAGGQVDRRSDLFSVGVMFYEALTGILPQGAFPPPSRLVPALSAAVDNLVMRLLQPRPDDRFATAEDTRRALEVALRPASEKARRPWLWAAGGAGVTLAGVSAAILLAPGKAKVDVSMSYDRSPKAIVSSNRDVTPVVPTPSEALPAQLNVESKPEPVLPVDRGKSARKVRGKSAIDLKGLPEPQQQKAFHKEMKKNAPLELGKPKG